MAGGVVCVLGGARGWVRFVVPRRITIEKIRPFTYHTYTYLLTLVCKYLLYSTFLCYEKRRSTLEYDLFLCV